MQKHFKSVIYFQSLVVVLGTALIFLFFAIAVACSSEVKIEENDKKQKVQIEILQQTNCLETFENFSRGDVYQNHEFWNDNVKPSVPWSVYASSPVTDDSTGSIRFIRSHNTKTKYDNTEIWIESGSREELQVYSVKLDSWETVSLEVIGTDRIVNDFFLADDGTIWGRTYWTIDNKMTLLSRLNEETREFERVYELHKGRLLELDSDGVFWMLVDGDGLYTFDTESDSYSRVIDFPHIFAEEMTITDQGDIYFIVVDKEDPRWDPFYPQLYPGSFLRFSKKTGELEEISLPEESWPLREGTLYDTGNQLWLDAVGYFDIETESWHPLYPDLSIYFSGDIFWGSPSLVLKDSYGIYWFALVFHRPIGTAWYDPVSGNGCMFTTSLSPIAEDRDHNLWMYLDGDLYTWQRH